MSDLTESDLIAAQRALYHATYFARAARRIVEQALPETGDAGEDRVCVTDLLSKIEQEASAALGLF